MTLASVFTKQSLNGPVLLNEVGETPAKVAWEVPQGLSPAAPIVVVELARLHYRVKRYGVKQSELCHYKKGPEKGRYVTALAS